MLRAGLGWAGLSCWAELGWDGLAWAANYPWTTVLLVLETALLVTGSHNPAWSPHPAQRGQEGDGDGEKVCVSSLKKVSITKFCVVCRGFAAGHHAAVLQ